MAEKRPRMIISPLWAQVAILTFVIGFAVLGYLAYSIYQDHPPLPPLCSYKLRRAISRASVESYWRMYCASMMK